MPRSFRSAWSWGAQGLLKLCLKVYPTLGYTSHPEPPRPRLQFRSLPAQLPEKRAKRVPTFPCPEDEVQKGAQDLGFGRACRAEQWSAVLIPQRGCGELVAELGFDQSCFGAGGKWK